MNKLKKFLLSDKLDGYLFLGIMFLMLLLLFGILGVTTYESITGTRVQWVR